MDGALSILARSQDFVRPDSVARRSVQLFYEFYTPSKSRQCTSLWRIRYEYRYLDLRPRWWRKENKRCVRRNDSASRHPISLSPSHTRTHAHSTADCDDLDADFRVGIDVHGGNWWVRRVHRRRSEEGRQEGRRGGRCPGRRGGVRGRVCPRRAARRGRGQVRRGG